MKVWLGCLGFHEASRSFSCADGSDAETVRAFNKSMLFFFVFNSVQLVLPSPYPNKKLRSFYRSYCVTS